MKILAIRLKNLTSIEGVVEVDFTVEPLRSSGIFAISGATGSGKSTLLDALCLALYDRAPRFANSVESISLPDAGDSQINQSDVRNLLRRGMGEGYAEVDFVSVTGNCYRSLWSVRRTRNKADGSLRNQTIEVCNLTTGEELQGTKKELLAQLVDLIGLTYEQFTRTVLLAQNDFATFLKSRGAAKAELLEKLTGTDIYSRISQEVFIRSKASQEEVNLVRGKMSTIELIPEDEYQTLLQEKEVQNSVRATGIKLLADMNAQLNILRSLKTQEELFEKKRKEELNETENCGKLAEILLAKEAELERFKMQWEAIQPDLKAARKLDVQIQEQQTNYSRAEQTMRIAKQRTTEQEKKLQTVTVALQTALRSLAALLKHDSSEEMPLDKVEEELRREEQRLLSSQKANDECVSRLKSFGYPALVEEQGRGQKELARQQNIRQLRSDNEKACQEINRLEKESAEVILKLAAKEGERHTLQRLYDNARLAIGKDVEALRQQLQKEEPCPVCGSKEHPYYEGEQIADAIYKNIEQEYNAVTADYQQVNNRNIAIQRDLQNFKSMTERYAAQLNALQKEGEERLGEEEINKHLEELAAKIRAYHELYHKWQEQDEELKQLRVYCESLREGVAQCRLLKQEEAAMQEQLGILRNAESTEQERFKAIDGELANLRRERSSLLKGKSADEAEAVVAKREKELSEALDKSRKEAEEGRTRISGLQGEMRQLSAALKELNAQKECMEFPEQLPEFIKKQQEDNLNTERLLSAIEARILQQSKNKVAQERLVKELDTKLLVAEKWAKLNKLIGSADGTKFKVIAQGYTLNLLLLHANRHLSYLSRRYKLQQVPGTLALQVIDGDMCDEIRTIYSLSGGESFLISLALALGLSSLSSNNLKVESLFIDEGFGSLDADSLRIAMEALEQLQMQGRQIGVISHVQEMSERITVQIKVDKKVNGKSVLTVVG